MTSPTSSRGPAPTAEAAVAAAASPYDEGDGAVIASALRALARRQAGAGKTCASCAERKPLAAYGADSSKPDGLRSWCRSCRRPGRRV